MQHQMELLYPGELRTNLKHLRSNNSIITDAPVDNHGKGEAFSPTDLMCASLASCMITIMGILANRKGWKMDGTKAQITKVMIENPRRVREIKIDFKIPAKDFGMKERQMIEAAAKTCPVALSLHPDVIQNVSFEYC